MSPKKAATHCLGLAGPRSRFFSAAIFVLVLFTLITLFAVGVPKRSHKSMPRNVFAQALALPATGVWSGFNRQVNVLECLNLSEEVAALLLEVDDYAGRVLGEKTVELGPFAVTHLILNEFGIEDNYGTFRIEAAEEKKQPKLHCQTLFYRDAPGREGLPQVEYAFSIPVRDALTGVSGGMYNSINPDNSPELPVYNWLSLFNPGQGVFRARVEVFDQAGKLLQSSISAGIALLPGDRMDIALGHDQGRAAGIYRIVPDDLKQPYGAYLARYSPRGADQFNYAFVLDASDGFNDSGPVSASTMGSALNWAEIGNLSASEEEVEVRVYLRDGALAHEETLRIPAHSQHHLYLNEYLGENNLGFFQVRSLSGRSSLLAQSLFYGRGSSPTGLVRWAYGTKPNGVLAGVSEVILSVNTFYNAANWLKLFALGSEPLKLALELRGLDGQEITSRFSSVLLRGSVDIPLHEDVGHDWAGTVAVRIVDPLRSSAVLGFSGEIIRVIPELIPSGALPRTTETELLRGVYSTRSGLLEPSGEISKIIRIARSDVKKASADNGSSSGRVHPAGLRDSTSSVQARCVIGAAPSCSLSGTGRVCDPTKSADLECPRGCYKNSQGQLGCAYGGNGISCTYPFGDPNEECRGYECVTSTNGTRQCRLRDFSLSSGGAECAHDNDVCQMRCETETGQCTLSGTGDYCDPDKGDCRSVSSSSLGSQGSASSEQSPASVGSASSTSNACPPLVPPPGWEQVFEACPVGKVEYNSPIGPSFCYRQETCICCNFSSLFYCCMKNMFGAQGWDVRQYSTACATCAAGCPETPSPDPPSLYHRINLVKRPNRYGTMEWCVVEPQYVGRQYQDPNSGCPFYSNPEVCCWPEGQEMPDSCKQKRCQTDPRLSKDSIECLAEIADTGIVYEKYPDGPHGQQCDLATCQNVANMMGVDPARLTCPASDFPYKPNRCWFRLAGSCPRRYESQCVASDTQPYGSGWTRGGLAGPNCQCPEMPPWEPLPCSSSSEICSSASSSVSSSHYSSSGGQSSRSSVGSLGSASSSQSESPYRCMRQVISTNPEASRLFCSNVPPDGDYSEVPGTCHPEQLPETWTCQWFSSSSSSSEARYCCSGTYNERTYNACSRQDLTGPEMSCRLAACEIGENEPGAEIHLINPVCVSSSSSSPTPEPTPTLTSTATAAITFTATPTSAATNTQAATMTLTPSATATRSPTFTATKTATLTATKTATLTWTPLGTKTKTATRTPTRTRTKTATPTRTATLTRTPTRVTTRTATPTRTSSLARTVTFTPTASRTMTRTATTSATALLTPPPPPTLTRTPTRVPTITVTATAAVTATPPTQTPIPAR